MAKYTIAKFVSSISTLSMNWKNIDAIYEENKIEGTPILKLAIVKTFVKISSKTSSKS